VKLSSNRWLALVLVPFLGCAGVTTDTFDETVFGAVADASVDVAEDAGQPPADTSLPPPDDAGARDTGITKPDTAVAPDTRQDTAVAPDTRPDTTPPPLDAPATSDVQCSNSPTGGTTCSGGQHCCITTSAGGGRNYACQSVILPVTCTGVDLACDATSDCAGMPGTVCCGTLNNAMGTTSLVAASSCVAASQCTQMNNRIILCNPSQPNVCPAGRTCKQSSGTLPGYYLCLQ
jgi:hypothetical protein